MTRLEREAARLLCVGFDGTAPNDHIDGLLRRGVGGVILFSRNVQSPPQVAELSAELKRRAGYPLILSIDQEGGRVMRLREGFTDVPPMRLLGQTADRNLAREVGRLLALECRAVHIDLNYAPVLDVDTNPRNPVIADRSFGADARLVSEMGAALIQGMQQAGVAACGKHFPGHGDTSQDSHLALPTLDHDLSRIGQIELEPFRAAAQAGVAAIMTAHILMPRLDADAPATLSHRVIDGILRRQIGYDGVVVSDDLEMKAVAANYDIPQAAVRGVAAGVDLLLICHREEMQHRAIDALVHAVEDGQIPVERVREANRRLDALCSRFVQFPPGSADPGAAGAAEHRAIVERIRSRASAASEKIADPTEAWRG